MRLRSAGGARTKMRVGVGGVWAPFWRHPPFQARVTGAEHGATEGVWGGETESKNRRMQTGGTALHSEAQGHLYFSMPNLVKPQDTRCV